MKTANQDLANQAESDNDEVGTDASANVPTSGADPKADTDAVAEKALSQDSEMTHRPPRGVSEKNHSVLGKSVAFKGDLHAEEDLFIQGKIEGSIQHDADCLTIGVHGKVKAKIVGRRIIVQGRISGNVHATESVVIEPSAYVRGDIFAPMVGLKEGAKFKGRIDMDSDPIKVAAGSRSAAANREVATKNREVATKNRSPSAVQEEPAEVDAAKPSTTAERKSTTGSAKKRSTRKTREKK